MQKFAEDNSLLSTTPTPQGATSASVSVLSGTETGALQLTGYDIVYTIGQAALLLGIGIALIYCGWKRLNNFDPYDPDFTVQKKNRALSHRIKVICAVMIIAGIAIMLGVSFVASTNQLAP